MRSNKVILGKASKEQILGEYKLIQEKKSKLGRALRDGVTYLALKYIAYDERRAKEREIETTALEQK